MSRKENLGYFVIAPIMEPVGSEYAGRPDINAERAAGEELGKIMVDLTEYSQYFPRVEKNERPGSIVYCFDAMVPIGRKEWNDIINLDLDVVAQAKKLGLELKYFETKGDALEYCMSNHPSVLLMDISGSARQVESVPNMISPELAFVERLYNIVVKQSLNEAR